MEIDVSFSEFMKMSLNEGKPSKKRKIMRKRGANKFNFKKEKSIINNIARQIIKRGV